MKRFIVLLTGLGATLVFLPMAWAAPGDGLALTNHDFSGFSSPETGLCTFCHTPHNAQTQELLWNHKKTTQNFTWSSPATTGATPYPNFDGDTYKGPSSKCLSCHDGSVAVGDIGWWDGAIPAAPIAGPVVAPLYQIGTGGDMSLNHPVAMPFPLGGVASFYNGVTNGASSLISGWQADPESLGIRLFTDDGSGNITAGSTSGQTGIECTSCHDVHNGPNTQGPYFLLGELGGNTTDYICVKCHDK